MPEPIQNTIQRVIVAFDDAQRSRATLETAAQLAAQLQAELQGLFVEDENLLRLANLPFACEIGGTTAALRPLTPQAIERTFRAKADEAKRSLIATAQRVQVQWSFQIRRSQLPQTTLAAAEDADVTVVCHSPARRQAATLQQTTTPSRHTTLAVVMDGSAGAIRALRIALLLSQQIGSLLIVMVPTAASDLAELRAQTTAIVAEYPHCPPPIIAAIASLESFAERFHGLRQHLRFALLGRETFFSAEPLLQQVIHQLDCQLGLVR